MHFRKQSASRHASARSLIFHRHPPRFCLSTKTGFSLPSF
nr:MAG TPA: hypothetical protein [Caudoviricetes sp.]